jgi:SAM-dependent methyltransferase
MDISANMAAMLLREHRYKPLKGRLLSIGRQTVYMTETQAKQLVEQEIGYIKPNFMVEIDQQTRSAAVGMITDRSFYSMFADVEYSALDVSDYEGADIVWDLCQPVPEALHDRFDLIFNGSCLDNLFDPASAIKNMTRLTTSGGRIIHTEHLSRGAWVPDAYLGFSCAWFHDYYAINNFADCKVYLALWEGHLDRNSAPWTLMLYQHEQDMPYDPKFEAYGFVIAEKGENSTVEETPVQFQYRHGAEQETYRAARARFNASPRPIIGAS